LKINRLNDQCITGMADMTNQVGKTVSPENEEELVLLKLVATGDRSALTRLYLLYHARLFTFVFRLTRSYATADEIVNDTMLVVWDKAASFRGDSKVSTWIFGIAYKQTMRRVTRKQLRLSLLTDLDDAGHDHDAIMENEDWVRQGLHTLPAAQKLTVVLVFYLGLTYKETAEVTECPVNTVKTRMFHARRKLKKYLSASAIPETMTRETNDE
jgi:RNA polymerase sigma-70 factor (ECF subfamily)